jgi:hypothetical protein
MPYSVNYVAMMPQKNLAAGSLQGTLYSDPSISNLSRDSREVDQIHTKA